MRHKTFRRAWILELGVVIMWTIVSLFVFSTLVLMVALIWPALRWLLVGNLVIVAPLIARWVIWRQWSITLIYGPCHQADRSRLAEAREQSSEQHHRDLPAEGLIPVEILLRENALNEKSIPMNFPPITGFQQDVWGWFLNYGNLELTSLGGPLRFKNMGQFRQLKTALQSQGSVYLAKRPSIATQAFAWLMPRARAGMHRIAAGAVVLLRRFAGTLVSEWHRAMARRASAVRLWPRQALPAGNLLFEVVIDPSVVSYAGLLAFCDDWLFTDQAGLPLTITLPDPSRHYYPEGLAINVAQVYFETLRQARVIIPSLLGNGACEWQRSPRIRTLADVQRWVTVNLLEDVSIRYMLATVIEMPHVDDLSIA
ncbi:MAG: hypothetical protein KKA73_05145 [Chloroflexi bacterium]|nr:hypothetical protein [Chloroflexota bacterium]MBU1747054.1 hypothetical protein [Chloroflexota bacterium]